MFPVARALCTSPAPRDWPDDTGLPHETRMDDTGRDQQRETSVEKYMMLSLVFTLGHTPMAMSGGVGEHGEEVGNDKVCVVLG